MIDFFTAVGLPIKDTGESSSGQVFLAGDSWLEIWQSTSEMPEGTMLQIVVDDADAFAELATSNGLEPQGPFSAHGEKIYFLQAPSGLNVTIQSADC